MWGSTAHDLVKVLPEMQLIVNRDGKLCASVLDFSILLSWRCSESRPYCGPPPCTNLRQCGGGILNANEKMLQRVCCCCASTKAKGCSIVKYVGVSVSPLMLWRRKCMLSAWRLSIGKMIDFLLKLFWCRVVVTWESLIHKLWVGNREGGKTCFPPRREKALTVQLCSGLNKRNSAHVVFISDAPLKCLQVLGL